MCFRVDCKQCGKLTWSGCGKHLVDIYANIEKGKHCMCKDWPGVAIPTEDAKKKELGTSTSAVTDKIKA